MRIILKEQDNHVTVRNSKEKCIRYGAGESWCISRKDASNMYNTYRYSYDQDTFYFIFDSERTDEFSKVVLLVKRDGSYYLANKDNSGNFTGGKKFTWDEIVRIVPKIKNLKHLFKPEIMTDSEMSDYIKIKQRSHTTNLSDYFGSYDLVEKYISFGHDLSNSQFNNLPKELKNKFLNMGGNITSLDGLDDTIISKYLKSKIITTKHQNGNINKRLVFGGDIMSLPDNIIFPSELSYESNNTIRSYNIPNRAMWPSIQCTFYFKGVSESKIKRLLNIQKKKGMTVKNQLNVPDNITLIVSSDRDDRDIPVIYEE